MLLGPRLSRVSSSTHVSYSPEQQQQQQPWRKPSSASHTRGCLLFQPCLSGASPAELFITHSMQSESDGICGRAAIPSQARPRNAQGIWAVCTSCIIQRATVPRWQLVRGPPYLFSPLPSSWNRSGRWAASSLLARVREGLDNSSNPHTTTHSGTDPPLPPSSFIINRPGRKQRTQGAGGSTDSFARATNRCVCVCVCVARHTQETWFSHTLSLSPPRRGVVGDVWGSRPGARHLGSGGR